MKAISVACQGVPQLKEQMNSIVSSEFRPTLAIVFSSVSHDLDQISQIFTQYEIELFGCTTAGEIVDNELLSDSISIMLLEIDKQHFKILTKELKDEDILEAATEVGNQVKNTFSNPGILLLSGRLSINAEKLIKGIKNGVQSIIPIYGALAGDNLNMEATYVFTNDKISSNGICTLVFNTDVISISGLATSGWEAVGVENTVTEAKGNLVLKINGENAFTVFKRYFGYSENPQTNEDQLIGLQTNYPLQFIKEGGHTVLRSPLLIDPEIGSITLAGSVEVGDKFRFSYAPGFHVIEQTIEEIAELKRSNQQADAVILFSCKGRHGAFGPLLKKEIQGIYNYWESPMTGFLSYGEIGDIGNGRCEFHNETCSLVLLKEKTI